jgi:hypothetical protein
LFLSRSKLSTAADRRPNERDLDDLDAQGCALRHGRHAPRWSLVRAVLVLALQAAGSGRPW